MSGLPQGWAEAAVTEIVGLHDARRIPLNATQRAEMKGAFPYYGANGLVDHVNDYLFDGDFVLLAEDGGYFDDPSRGVAYEASGKFWVNNHAHILEPLGGVTSRYLRHQLNAVDWMPFVGGSTRLKLTQGGLERARVQVPPLPEQRRIVAKIDSITGKSRRARYHLDHIPRLVEKYKQALLAAAFRGELTREWPDQGRLACDDRGVDERLTNLGILRAGWLWTSMGAVAQISGGLTKNASRNNLPLRVPYLRVGNVYANELRLNEIMEIGCTEREYQRTMVQPGDLLIVEGNGSLDQIGRVALWNGEYPGCAHQNHLIRARMGSDVIPAFALFWLLSPQGRTCIETVASSSSGLHTLSISKVNGLPIPICSKAEQEETVRRIKSALAWIDRLVSEATSARHLVDRLDPAVLAKAFRGELVPQDPDDEPASVLLERIRAERSMTPKAKRGRRTKADA